jgi:hypothetical protein
MAFEVFVLCWLASAYAMFLASLVHDAARNLMRTRVRARADSVTGQREAVASADTVGRRRPC